MTNTNVNYQVSVIMPVYNGEEFLREAIDSILQQTYTNFEFIIINDGSMDSSESIILSYTDTRIKYVKNERNIKLIATLNKGFAMAQGKYITRMDADDYSVKERLEKQVRFMEANPDVALAGSWFETFGDDTSRVVKYESDVNFIRFKMLYQTQFCHPAVILRKAVTDQLQVLFDRDYIHAEDYELFSRIAYKFPVSNLPEVLLKYRTHSSNVSVLYKDVQIENSLKIKVSNFKAIGVDATTEEVQLFEELAHQNYSNLADGILVIEGLLIKMQNASQSNRVIKGDFLANYASNAWFNMCYNLIGKVSSIRSVFFNSEITKAQIKTTVKLRFMLKSLMA